MIDFEWKDPRTGKVLKDSDHHKQCGFCVCNCNLSATLRVGRFAGKVITIARYSGGSKLNTGVMVKKMLLQMNNLFMYTHNSRIDSLVKSRVQTCNNIIHLSSAVNQTPIPRMLSHTTLPRDAKLPLVPDTIYTFYRAWDIHYANVYLGLNLDYDFFYNCVWKDTPFRAGLPWDILVNGGVLPLLNIMMIKQSWYNRCFAGDEGGRYVGAAMTNLFEKIPAQVEKNNQPTRDLSDKAQELMNRCLPNALDMMYNYMEVNQHKNSIEWKWSERLVYALAPCGLNASGYRSCPRYVDKSEPGVTRIFSGIGKKVEQYPYACAEVFRLGNMAYKDSSVTLEHPDIHSYIVPKMEKQSVYTPWGKQQKIEQEDVNNKLRFFYLLSYVVTVAAACIGKIRHYIERGKAIKIGMTWWFGGANVIASQLGYGDDEMIWEDGDFSGQDRTINRALLTLYMAGNSRYTKFPTYQDKAVHDALTEWVAKRLSVKFTNVFGHIWRVVYGGMPSGAIDTSHGDSWIVALLFFLYIEDVIQKNPKIRKMVVVALRKGKIVIIIYGDDHIIGVLKVLHKYINERGFSFFVKYYFDMIIRNMRQSKSLLSIVKRDGTTCGSGVVFLQKYLIKNTIDPRLPEVLPFRPIEKTIIKCAYGSKGDKWMVTDYAVAAIGMAYDSQGTNPVAYDFCREMFHACVENLENRTFYTDYYAEKGDTSLTRIIRKAQIPVDCIREGFPSLKRLHDMHINDDSKNGRFAKSKIVNILDILNDNDIAVL